MSEVHAWETDEVKEWCIIHSAVYSAIFELAERDGAKMRYLSQFGDGVYDYNGTIDINGLVNVIQKQIAAQKKVPQKQAA